MVTKKTLSNVLCVLVIASLILVSSVMSSAEVVADGGKVNVAATTDTAIENPVPAPIPATPPNLKVKSAKAKQVTLKWNKIPNATNYQIYQKTGNGEWTKLKTLSASKSSYTKKKLELKKTYSYKIKAKVNGKYTEFSPIVNKVKVKGKYTQPSLYGSKLSKKELNKIRDKVADFVNKNQTWRMSQAEKADLAAQYITSTISYREWQKSKYYNTAYGGLIQKKGACSAYMRAYKALADGMGLKCKCIHTGVDYSAHQWCHVKVSGTWYILETQNGLWIGVVKKPKKNSDDLFENYYVLKK